MRSAIMDIGYNAIRAVVYEDETLGASELFSSKFKNDVLGLLSNESIDIKHQTYLTIQYLLRAFTRLEVNNIKCVATAVLRNHPRAQEFIEKISAKYGINVEIIPGDEEAKLTALGVMAGIKNCHGIAIDLGGGSLELAEVSENKVGKLKSLELGTKILSSSNLNEEEVFDILKEEYGDGTYDNIYLIGGALRFIAKIYLDFMHYPIRNLHNLTIPIDDFLNHLDSLDTNAHEEDNSVSHHNIHNKAIFVTRAMMRLFQPKQVIVSIYGLKEGVRIAAMDSKEREKDIIFEKVKRTCDFDTSKVNFDSYADIILPLTNSKEKLKELIPLAIMLTAPRRKFDKTLKPIAIAEFILSSEIPFTHKERIMLALILSYSTNHKPSPNLLNISRRLISPMDHSDSQIIGHFLHITEEMDGPQFTIPSFSIIQKNHFLEIQNNTILPRHIFERVCYRLKSIALVRKMSSNQ